MKPTYIFAALLGLAVAAPSPTPESFDVDLSGLVEDGLETRAADVTLEIRACGGLEYCVGHRCVRLVYSPIPRSSTCITYKYGPC
jgi:hypothetical protein